MQTIDLLKILLQKKLPGHQAHIEMFPPSRLKEIRKPSESTKKSAVLFMLYEKNDNLYTTLIVRTKGNNAHSGQIGFPGGKCEKYDKNVVATALREANEEIGVNIENIQILGQLSRVFIPVSNFLVYPIVGFHTGDLRLTPNKIEVAEVFEASIKSLLNPDNKCISKVNAQGKLIDAPIFLIQNKKIWGATAMIINEFVHILSKTLNNNDFHP